MSEPLRVAIADAHTLVREGLRLILDAQPDIRVVGEAANAAEAVWLADERRPEVLILDLRLPDQNGIEVLAQLPGCSPATKVLILTVDEEPDLLFQALRAGAFGYLLKGSTSRELIEAIHVIAAGENYLSPRMTSALVREFRRGWVRPGENETPPQAVLSGREIEVLQCLAQGQTNVETAAGLVISASTVQTHRTRIFKKLNLQTRADLVKYALRHGLIQLD
jgi:two-component system response regulator NreC